MRDSNDAKSARQTVAAPRGMTLIELMVVVAIIGVLAGLAGMAYMKQIKQGKISQMKQWALEVEKGQKEYYSRMSSYLTPSEDYFTSSTDPQKEWHGLLGFKHPEIKSLPVTVKTEGGESGGSCSICDAGNSNLPDDADNKWYAVVVERDLDSEVDTDTIVYLDSTTPRPIIVNEGD